MRLPPAAADRLELLEAVREFEQSTRAGEGFGAEVGADAVCQHRDAVEHHDPQQIVDLRGGEELRLVDEKAGHIDRATGRRLLGEERFRAGLLHACPVLGEQLAQIGIRVDEEVDRTRHPEPAGDLVGLLRVDRGLREQHVLAALLVVVRGLQERRRLAGVHRPVAEVQFGHVPSVAAGRLASIRRGVVSAPAEASAAAAAARRAAAGRPARRRPARARRGAAGGPGA